MFPIIHRLPLRESREFFRTARSVHTRQLSLFWQPSTTQFSRAAIIIKKSSVPLATQRSTLKRKLRTIILPHLVSSPTTQDLVFIYKGKPSITSKELTTHVKNILAMARD